MMGMLMEMARRMVNSSLWSCGRLVAKFGEAGEGDDVLLIMSSLVVHFYYTPKIES